MNAILIDESAISLDNANLMDYISLDQLPIFKNQFKLSTGVYLYFRCGWESDSALVKSPVIRHYKALSSNSKKGKLLLYGNKSYDSLIFADFDLPPSDFGFSSYDALKKDLEEKLGNDAVVFFSSSRKVKAAFPVHGKLTQSEGLSFLKSVLPEYYSNLDHSVSAMTCTFLDWDSATVLSESLPATKVHTLNPEQTHILVADKHKWKIYTRSIECVSSKIKLNRSEKMVIRFVFGSAYRSMFLSGIQLPSTYISETFNREISIKGVCKAIKSLEEKGLLRLVSSSYQPGKKAKSYRAAGIAFEFCRKIVSELEEWKSNRKTKKFKPAEPEQVIIEDGDWNKRLFVMTCLFNNENKYLEYVSRIPNFNEKSERLSQAKSSWKSHTKRLLRRALKVA
ncbi:hypothetical protein [Geothrix sp. PMB-07]|uniref:hypothetical protein n=1 Tax=Geothrix sp. PMB-07 TaxID=3068640 RepID=UPI002741ED58|nr:hypothetical protein [Geothrix sp. PMB-07]WLT30291.1 hypothetical protein Q9293_11235 [Geothrix sp. PMB-07]